MELSQTIKLAGEHSSAIQKIVEMVRTINSSANTISPDHDALLKAIRLEFDDSSLTLITMTDTQVGQYFMPGTPDNIQAIAGLQLVLLHWDKLFHALVEGKEVMPPLDV